jgi:hypothetical protein
VGGERLRQLGGAVLGVGEHGLGRLEALGVRGELGPDGSAEGAEGDREGHTAGHHLGDPAGEPTGPHPRRAQHLEEVLDRGHPVADLPTREGEGGRRDDGRRFRGGIGHAVGLTSYPAKK